MIRTGHRQGIWAAGAVVACSAAAWLAAPAGWLPARAIPAVAARDGARDLPLSEGPASPGTAGATTADDVAARFASTTLDDAQRRAEGELAASRAELDAAPLRPEALISQEAGGRYAALDVDSPPVAPPAAPPR